MAASAIAQSDAEPFKGNLSNDEYRVYINFDFHGSGINVPGHEILGQLPGYLAKQRNSFYWLITSAKIVGKDKAEIELINDYGSEDLTATLTIKDDSTYVLTQGDGSALKVPNDGKWHRKAATKTRFKEEMSPTSPGGATPRTAPSPACMPHCLPRGFTTCRRNSPSRAIRTSRHP